MQLHGQITKFRGDIGVGIIRAEDGRHYRFARDEIVNKGSELVGSDVDFLVVSRQPKQIFLMAGSPWTAFGGNA
jgi:hypothetical protein